MGFMLQQATNAIHTCTLTDNVFRYWQVLWKKQGRERGERVRELVLSGQESFLWNAIQAEIINIAEEISETSFYIETQSRLRQQLHSRAQRRIHILSIPACDDAKSHIWIQEARLEDEVNRVCLEIKFLCLILSHCPPAIAYCLLAPGLGTGTNGIKQTQSLPSENFQTSEEYETSSHITVPPVRNPKSTPGP